MTHDGRQYVNSVAHLALPAQLILTILNKIIMNIIALFKSIFFYYMTLHKDLNLSPSDNKLRKYISKEPNWSSWFIFNYCGARGSDKILLNIKYIFTILPTWTPDPGSMTSELLDIINIPVFHSTRALWPLLLKPLTQGQEFHNISQGY